MDGFREGFEFFAEHASDFAGMDLGSGYVDSVNGEISEFIESVAHFKGMQSSVDTLKGDLAEFWHAGTFNIDAAVKGSGNRVQVDRSHDFGSVDVSGKNIELDAGLKYYKNGVESAKQQTKSVFEAYKKYQSGGGKETLEEYLKNRNYQDDSVLNDAVYSGQIRVIPADQLTEATKWLERKIAEEGSKRPEQVERYRETLKLLKDRISDNHGNESIPLSEEDAKKLAQLAKEGKINPEEWGLTTEELIKAEYILKQALKAGLNAATISIVLRTAPEIINAIKYLIENGEVDEEQFKKIGFAALKGGSEGFVRGTVSAAITTACKSGVLGAALKSVDPTVIGAVTVLVMDTVKNSYKVATGKMTRYEMSNELMRTMFTTTCSLALGATSQAFIEVPVVGYMIGSFVGSLVGSFTYSVAYKPAISFCVDTGFTLFGLVNQDYVLPEDVIREIGIDVFDYEQLEYDKFKPEGFQFSTFTPDKFEPEKIDMTFLRRGVIGINEIGFIE